MQGKEDNRGILDKHIIKTDNGNAFVMAFYDFIDNKTRAKNKNGEKRFTKNGNLFINKKKGRMLCTTIFQDIGDDKNIKIETIPYVGNEKENEIPCVGFLIPIDQIDGIGLCKQDSNSPQTKDKMIFGQTKTEADLHKVFYNGTKIENQDIKKVINDYLKSYNDFKKQVNDTNIKEITHETVKYLQDSTEEKTLQSIQVRDAEYVKYLQEGKLPEENDFYLSFSTGRKIKYYHKVHDRTLTEKDIYDLKKKYFGDDYPTYDKCRPYQNNKLEITPQYIWYYIGRYGDINNEVLIEEAYNKTNWNNRHKIYTDRDGNMIHHLYNELLCEPKNDNQIVEVPTLAICLYHNSKNKSNYTRRTNCDFSGFHTFTTEEILEKLTDEKLDKIIGWQQAKGYNTIPFFDEKGKCIDVELIVLKDIIHEMKRTKNYDVENVQEVQEEIIKKKNNFIEKNIIKLADKHKSKQALDDYCKEIYNYKENKKNNKTSKNKKSNTKASIINIK